MRFELLIAELQLLDHSGELSDLRLETLQSKHQVGPAGLRRALDRCATLGPCKALAAAENAIEQPALLRPPCRSSHQHGEGEHCYRAECEACHGAIRDSAGPPIALRIPDVEIVTEGVIVPSPQPKSNVSDFGGRGLDGIATKRMGEGVFKQYTSKNPPHPFFCAGPLSGPLPQKGRGTSARPVAICDSPAHAGEEREEADEFARPTPAKVPGVIRATPQTLHHNKERRHEQHREARGREHPRKHGNADRLAGAAPAPLASTSGSAPRMKANDVITMGRKRAWAASTADPRLALERAIHAPPRRSGWHSWRTAPSAEPVRSEHRETAQAASHQSSQRDDRTDEGERHGKDDRGGRVPALVLSGQHQIHQQETSGPNTRYI